MRSTTWESLKIFDHAVGPGEIRFQECALENPKGVDRIVREIWNKQLKEKQEQLFKTGLETKIRSYAIDGIKPSLSALFERDRPIMWPGPVVILRDVDIVSGQVDLNVAQTYFPFIKGLQDSRVVELYENQKITKPRPPLAICTFAQTTDDLLVITVRGEKTNMYPGRFYGQGGNPLYTRTDIITHQIEEMHDEIQVESSEFDPGRFKFLGIVIDNDELKGKPDLVGWVPVNLKSEDIIKKVEGRPVNERPNDATGVSFVPTDAEKLLKYLKETELTSFCPPAHGGLVLYGYYKFGYEWVKELLKKPNNILQSLD